MWQKETKNTVCRDAVSKIRDQHVGPAHFLVQQCQSPISTVLLPKLLDMHRATKAFGTTITSTDFRNICQKNRQIAQLRVRFPKTQKWPVEIAMKTRNVANSAITNDICFPVQRREKEKCNLRKKKNHMKNHGPSRGSNHCEKVRSTLTVVNANHYTTTILDRPSVYFYYLTKSHR